MRLQVGWALGFFMMGFVAACGSDPDPPPPVTSSASAGGSAGAGNGGAAGNGGTGTDAGGTGGATGGTSGDAGLLDDAPDHTDVALAPDHDAGDPDVSADGGPLDGTIDVPEDSSDAGSDAEAATSTDADASSDGGQEADASLEANASSDGGDGGQEADASLESSTSSDAGDGGQEADVSLGADVGPEAEAEAAAWTPARLSNLSLWLDAEVGVTSIADLVTVWRDRSGNGNEATQPLASRRPTLVSGSLNGHAVVRFDGQATLLNIPDAPSLRWGAGDYTIEVVGSFSNAPDVNEGYGLIYAKFEAPYPYIGPSLWASYPGVPGVLGAQNRTDEPVLSAETGLNDGKARLYGVRRTAFTRFEVRVDGAATSRTTNITNVDALGNFVFIGGNPQPTGVIQALKGDIAEMIAVGGSLPPADLAKLETYLKTKYGL